MWYLFLATMAPDLESIWNSTAIAWKMERQKASKVIKPEGLKLQLLHRWWNIHFDRWSVVTLIHFVLLRASFYWPNFAAWVKWWLTGDPFKKFSEHSSLSWGVCCFVGHQHQLVFWRSEPAKRKKSANESHKMYRAPRISQDSLPFIWWCVKPRKLQWTQVNFPKQHCIFVWHSQNSPDSAVRLGAVALWKGRSSCRLAAFTRDQPRVDIAASVPLIQL